MSIYISNFDSGKKIIFKYITKFRNEKVKKEMTIHYE